MPIVCGLPKKPHPWAQRVGVGATLSLLASICSRESLGRGLDTGREKRAQASGAIVVEQGGQVGDQGCPLGGRRGRDERG
eukprot:scaffold24167_cov26-Tisochrysis_lutea.AAC.2